MISYLIIIIFLDEIFVHADVNLNEAANFQSPLGDYKTWINEAEDFHLESGVAEPLPGLDEIDVEPYCVDVCDSQKYNESYNLNVSKGCECKFLNSLIRKSHGI